MEISCEEVRRELSNYFEDDITPQLRGQIALHFQQCRGCKALYDGVKNVLLLVSGSSVMELPSGFSQRLYQRIIASQRAN